MEKTDAQQRNEDEVRRIMRERGFETALESKPKKKRRDFDFSIIGKVLAAIVVISGLSFGVFALIKAPKNDEVVKDTSDNEDTPQNADYAGLAVCLNAAYTDIEAGDPQFYPKLIASYKAQLDCHNQYPTPDNESEISDIKQRLSNVEIAAKDAGVSQADIESAYSSISQQTTTNQSTNVNTTQNTGSNYSAPDCSAEEREVEIRKTLMVREEQQYNSIFNSRKSYSELADQAGDNLTQANILYAEQKARIDAAWQTYLDAQAAYNTAYDDMLNCERQ
ncbi:hypothetical protein IJ076_01910 [Candidatus Saccharibacteria bacterium]|nr:hypothetical protein [Candidatus Saccharibacteria bacterium]